MKDFKGLRIGYVPYDATLRQPGDRRRFCFWAAQRGIEFEIANPHKEYDVVYLTTRADITRWTRYSGSAKIIYELIDSYLALPYPSTQDTLRGLAKSATRELARPVISYRHALERMCNRADAVVCSTIEQAQDISEYNRATHIILDFHEELGGEPKKDHRPSDRLRLVWEGLPQNVAHFRELTQALQNVEDELPLEIHLVTDLRYKRLLGRFLEADTHKLAARYVTKPIIRPWSPTALMEEATICDLGIIPLDLTDPFAAGKPENKLLIFWRLGMPTLTSASPAYERVMAAAGLDMTCHTAEEWQSTLLRYGHSPSLRKQAATAGFNYVRKQHNVRHLLSRWDRLFETVLDSQ